MTRNSSDERTDRGNNNIPELSLESAGITTMDSSDISYNYYKQHPYVTLRYLKLCYSTRLNNSKIHILLASICIGICFTLENILSTMPTLVCADLLCCVITVL